MTDTTEGGRVVCKEPREKIQEQAGDSTSLAQPGGDGTSKAIKLILKTNQTL